jgi:N6-L-threonylcarbamoyladenine synthase
VTKSSPYAQAPLAVVLGIESSCDETAAGVVVDGHLRSNVVASQEVHARYGGVVPELAARAHQEHIVPVVAQALEQAGIHKKDLTAIAFTQGPGLLGALLVGTCFARSLSQALAIPLFAVDHLQAHVLAHFIRDGEERLRPQFPFLNLTVSGGHTLLVVVKAPLDMHVIGTTVDDAAGEALDKGAKLLGLPYPGGPVVERHARHGDPNKYPLPLPQMAGLNMSFSGLKTAFLQRIEKGEKARPGFALEERDHLCAALQHAVVRVLVQKVGTALELTGCTHLALSGGVAANSELRAAMAHLGARLGVQVHVAPARYCTDNGAMIAMAGYYLARAGERAGLDTVPRAQPLRWTNTNAPS